MIAISREVPAVRPRSGRYTVRPDLMFRRAAGHGRPQRAGLAARLLPALLAPIALVLTIIWLASDESARSYLNSLGVMPSSMAGHPSPVSCTDSSQSGTGAAHDPSDRKIRPTADLGCATITAPTFVREFCFSEFKEMPDEVYGGHIAASILLKVTKQERKGARGVAG